MPQKEMPMTLEEVSKLRREKPREFDALVAEKVMGWKLEKITTSGVHWWFDEDGDAESTGDSSVVGISFRPSDSAGSDYRVLCRVREIGPDALVAMRDKLKVMWECLAELRDERQVWGCTQYEPGDYAAAALAVVMGREKK